MTLTKPRYSGQIKFPDTIHDAVFNGSVLISGVSPNARVTILDFDASDRGQQVDVMRNVKVEERPDELVLRGESMHAVVHQKLSGGNAVITVHVDLKRCKNCPG